MTDPRPDYGVTPTGQAIHAAPHPQAGKAVLVDLDGGDLVTFYVEDWWDRVAGGSWMMAQGNPAAIKYSIRARRRGLPIDDKVVYGEINGFGVLVHDSEIRLEVITNNSGAADDGPAATTP